MKITCGSEDRRSMVKNHHIINGIDHIDVRIIENPDKTIPNPLVIVHCFKSIESLNSNNVIFEGGVRATGIKPEWGYAANKFEGSRDSLPNSLVSDKELELIRRIENRKNVLVVRANNQGDFSQYEIRIVKRPDQEQNTFNFDVILSRTKFSFKVECEKFDCACGKLAQSDLEEPAIDYLAKDYASFRKLMLDRLSLLIPDWRERNPSDQGIMLAELMAYVGDHLSYFQDVVSTEAYLGTARRRVSAVRHAHLLDYYPSDGCNARAWICITSKPHQSVSGKVLHEGTALLTGTEEKDKEEDSFPGSIEDELNSGTELFETMYDIILYNYKDEMSFYTWGETECWLPSGTTRATIKGEHKNLVFEFTWENVPGTDEEKLKEYLADNCSFDWILGATITRISNSVINLVNGAKSASLLLEEDKNMVVFSFLDFQYKFSLRQISSTEHVVSASLQAGDILIFEEKELDVRSPTDPSHRHAVQLTSVTPSVDPLSVTEVIEIEWNQEDALPFSLCLAKDGRSASTIWGNVVLADHGYTIGKNTRDEEKLENLVAAGRYYYPKLSRKPLTFEGPKFKQLKMSAYAAFNYDLEEVRPAMRLKDARGVEWEPLRDLLSSDNFADKFVVEVERDRTAYLRFSNANRKSWADQIEKGTFTPFKAIYRIGNGTKGNVGSDSITRISANGSATATTTPTGIKINNPLPARGGRDPETIESIRQHAPQAFRKQERAVTETDYENILTSDLLIQRAVARKRWTGSWYTMFVTIDRKGGLPVNDDVFKANVIYRLEKYKLAGYDIELREPVSVPLSVTLEICLKAGYYEGEVKERLLKTFSNMTLENGKYGFFHPDNFTFGQPLFLSSVYEAAMGVEGVQSVKATKFQKSGKVSAGELDNGIIHADSVEILRLDNDPNFAENGIIDITICGGAT